MYKVYRYQNETTSQQAITIEPVRKLNLQTKYAVFDVDMNGLAVVLSYPNLVRLWQVESPYQVRFVRQLPFFKYASNMIFWTNFNKHDIVYNRQGDMLYLIMVNQFHFSNRALFIYDLLETSHNCLKAVISLDNNYSKKKIFLYVDSIENLSTIFIYAFYEDKHYQFIKFEPDNVLAKNASSSLPLFLPPDFKSLTSYPDSVAVLLVSPLHWQNSFLPSLTLRLEVASKNTGLMIERRHTDERLSYLDNDAALNVSLLDYFDGFDGFDGFNGDYSLRVNGQTYDEQTMERYKVSEDRHYEYIIEYTSETNRLKAAFVFENTYLLLFFESPQTLQVGLSCDSIALLHRGRSAEPEQRGQLHPGI